MDKKNFEIRPIEEKDKKWIIPLLKKCWGSVEIVSRGKKHVAHELPGFVAVMNNKPAGFLTYRVDKDECEIISMNSILEGRGIGSTLLETVKDTALTSKCKRIWLITTNDNLKAMRFYQKRGFLLIAVHRNALDESRKIKPEIPLVGIDGIPLRDEIELELPLFV